jgi:hypothetical protein
MSRAKSPKAQPSDAAIDATNPGKSEHPKDAYTGRPDQGLTRNLGPGAGGATEWGGGNKNHPAKRVKPGPVR